MISTEPTPLRVSEASLAALEYPSLLAVVASQGATDLGRERILALLPLADAAALGERRGLVKNESRSRAGRVYAKPDTPRAGRGFRPSATLAVSAYHDRRVS
jgi:hypothetical protein